MDDDIACRWCGEGNWKTFPVCNTSDMEQHAPNPREIERLTREDARLEPEDIGAPLASF